MKRNLLIIDGHNFLWRAYSSPFKFYSRKGTPLHVITVFLSLLRRVIKITKECSIIVIFDSDGKTTNHELSNLYKANRKDFTGSNDSPYHHLSYIQTTLRFLKIKTFKRMGWEADDIIASIATQYLKTYPQGKVFIASSDSDFYQLASKSIIQVVLGRKGLHALITPKVIKEKYNITPKQYVEFKSLMGDKTDNITGISNIGPIRASQVVNKKLEIDLHIHRELLERNRKLIKLNRKLKLPKNLLTLRNSKDILSLKNNDIFRKSAF